MLVVAFLVGFRIEGSIAEAVAATLLLFAFAYAFCWIQALTGLSVGSTEAVNSASFIWMFPLTFISSAFVPVESMPAALQWFADINPFTIVVDAMRALWLGAPAGNNVWGAVAWSLGILAVFAPLAVARYRKTAALR
jgi:ABC-2 type transport system permease protein/oleandomycin transport system permease protein